MTNRVVPDEQVGRALETAISAIVRWSTRAEVHRQLHDSGGTALSATDSWLLGRIADTGPVRMSQLATWQSVDRSTMTVQVRRLEEAGLVGRQQDPADRRAVLVAATAEGHTIIDLHRGVAQKVFDGLITGWSSRERSDLARLLGKLAAEVDASTGSPLP